MASFSGPQPGSTRKSRSIMICMWSNPVASKSFLAASFGLCLAALLACAPALNWREVRMPSSHVSALFPCKPDHFVRQVVLVGAPRPMHLGSCAAAGSTYAISHVDVSDAAQITPALQALRTLAAENIGAPVSVIGPHQVAGMAAHRLAERLSINGKRRDGATLLADAVFFVNGTVVYQATVVGDQRNAEAIDTFFAALKLP